MKVLIVSDTHGKREALERVIQEESFDALVHCGDLEGQESYLEEAVDCPVYMVAGNNDFFSNLDREMEIELGGTRVMITHGHYYGVSIDLGELMDEARSREVPVVLFGHTHRPVISERHGVTAVNPGSLAYPRQKGREPSYVVLTISSDGKFHFEIKYLTLSGKSPAS